MNLSGIFFRVNDCVEPIYNDNNYYYDRRIFTTYGELVQLGSWVVWVKFMVHNIKEDFLSVPFTKFGKF